MPSSNTRHGRLPTVWASVALACGLAAPLVAQVNPFATLVAGPSSADLAQGKRFFDAQCARCHGIGGTGGLGPNLVRPKLRRAPDDEALLGLIREGIPGTPMGLEFELSDRELAQVAAYVQSLGRLPDESLAGDPARADRL